MSTLYFRVSSDWQEVVRLREEINKLESQLKSFGKSTPEQQIRQTEERLASTRQEFMKLTTEAAKAGAAMENDFKKKIYDASQTVNGLTEKIIAQKMIRLTQEQAQEFYEELKDKAFFAGMTTQMSSGPIIVQVLEGEDAIAHYRKIMGATNPAVAEEGTIRKTYALSIEKNTIHGSDSPQSAAREIAFFFNHTEIVG